ncbi:hypothetical protein, partial [Parasynechococcus sp.]|uniref:hypothetical protein n=1 Tax=Parasynechococcus sp. TaxID=3101203 RepID=UPI0037046AA2
KRQNSESFRSNSSNNHIKTENRRTTGASIRINTDQIRRLSASTQRSDIWYQKPLPRVIGHN